MLLPAKVLWKGRKHGNILGWKDHNKTAEKPDHATSRGNQDIGEIREIKSYQDKVIKYNQNKTLQNNEIKFYLKLGGECTRTYQQPDADEANLF